MFERLFIRYYVYQQFAFLAVAAWADNLSTPTMNSEAGAAGHYVDLLVIPFAPAARALSELGQHYKFNYLDEWEIFGGLVAVALTVGLAWWRSRSAQAKAVPAGLGEGRQTLGR